MKQTINQTQFINAFQSWGAYKDNFSYAGLELLFNYFEEFEADTESEIELDVVAICCEFSEMDITEFLQAYNPLVISSSEEEQVQAIVEYLEYNTSFIGYTDDKTFIFAQW